MSSLPEEIIEENILTRLPVKSISRFRCVSKTWCSLFQNPNFIQRHLNHANLMNKFNILVANREIDSKYHLSSIDNSVLSTSSPVDDVISLEIDYPLMSPECAPEILGSCNGLVFIKPFYSGMCIWNPATREYKRVHDPPSSDLNGFCFTYHGFGFDCKNDDYKVLRIESFRDSPDSEAMLYSLASNSWKKLGFVPYDSILFSAVKGLLHNGILHWIDYGLNSRKVIVCFDVSDETFCEVLLPKKDPDYSFSDTFLGIWEGRLCLFCQNRMEDSDMCVWTMIDSKWIKHLEITAEITDMSYRRPIQTLQNGETLLEGRPKGEKGIGLISYNPDLERARVLKIHDSPSMSDVETYIETLVPLNSGTYVGK